MKIKDYEVTQEDMDRFESKIFVVTEGDHIGCYETTCCKNKDGYSIGSINSKNILAHRLMYQIWHPDENIDNLFICHRCDNPACVNPEHLFSGTSQDNEDDKVNKDRQAKGSKNGNSKLTDVNIIEFINLTLSGDFTSCYDIAEHYNVSYEAIIRIINQKMWTHVTKDYDMIKIKSLLDNSNKILNDDQIREIRLRSKNGEELYKIADFYDVSYSVIYRISTGRTYKDVV